MALIILVVFAFIFIGLAVYFVTIYNGLITVSKNIDKAWANIDVLLKQRHDEIPKIIKTCESYANFEKSTLEKITLARTECMKAKTVLDSSKAEGALSGLLTNLFAVAENYPELKTNQNFLQLQERISYLEGQIADRREFFNDSVNSYNIRIEQLPDVFFARMLNMQPRDMFKVSEEDRQDVDISFNM